MHPRQPRRPWRPTLLCSPACAPPPCTALTPSSPCAPHPPTHPQATLAACNVAATLQGYPAWNKPDVLPFVDGPFEDIPKAAPSLVNAKELGLKTVA